MLCASFISRRCSKSCANGTATLYSYDALDRVTRIEQHDPAGNVFDFQAYTYNPAGLVDTLTTPDRRLREWPSMRHEIFNELGKEDVYAETSRWISEHL